MKIKFFLIVALCFGTLYSYTQSNITDFLIFGKYNVGYRVSHIYDNSRSFFQKYDYYDKRTEHPIGRPIQVSIWYPSKIDTKSNNLLYKDYIGFTSSEIDFKKTSVEDRNNSINALVNSLNNN